MNCTGTESSLRECQSSLIPSAQNCGYAGVFCQSKSNFRSAYFWLGKMFLPLTVTIDSSETRQTTGFPFPASTVNPATSSISTSGNVTTIEQDCCRVLFNPYILVSSFFMHARASSSNVTTRRQFIYWSLCTNHSYEVTYQQQVIVLLLMYTTCRFLRDQIHSLSMLCYFIYIRYSITQYK